MMDGSFILDTMNYGQVEVEQSNLSLDFVESFVFLSCFFFVRAWAGSTLEKNRSSYATPPNDEKEGLVFLLWGEMTD